MAPRGRLHSGGTSISHLYKEIFVERLYRSSTPIAPGERILDAGAHVGLASLFFLTEYPGARVVSVEPNPAAGSVLEQNLARYGTRSTIIRAALASEAGAASFFVTRDEPLNVNAGTRNRARSGEAVTVLRVPRIAVGELLDEPVAHAKLDVEGDEYELLQHPAFRPEHVRSLVVEFHDVHEHLEAFDATLERLERRGYTTLDRHAQPFARGDLVSSLVLRFAAPR